MYKMAAGFSKQSGTRSAHANCLHTHTYTEEGCSNTIVSAGTFTGCWNFYLMQKCSSASLYLVSARLLILLDVKEKNAEGGKNILLFF